MPLAMQPTITFVHYLSNINTVATFEAGFGLTPRLLQVVFSSCPEIVSENAVGAACLIWIIFCLLLLLKSSSAIQNNVSTGSISIFKAQNRLET